MKAILLPLALLLGACSPPVASMPQSEAPAVITERMPGGPPPARGEQLLRDVMLSRQNAARRAVDAPPLVWNEALVASARSYAAALHQKRAVLACGPPYDAGADESSLMLSLLSCELQPYDCTVRLQRPGHVRTVFSR